MVFSSLKFIFIFLPIFLVCYYAAPAKWRNAVLLTGSFVFYSVGAMKSPEHILIFMMCILVDYFSGIIIEDYPQYSRYMLTGCIGYHIVCLGSFKYLGFFAGELNRLLTHHEISVEIVLPIGISFFTFQGISYVVDVYRGKNAAERSLIDFAAYISMFEQLIAGPIVTYSDVAAELKYRRITPENILKGAESFVFGLGIKVLLANPLGRLWEQTGNIGYESISTPLAWMAIAAFSFQLYFDFFGYSLMAIGLGKMIGFEIPENFRHPYISKTMTEFWRRWHMTLGSWFREYLYIPLGGNRVSTVKAIRNLLVVWLFTGVWHGAGYNFILWGLFLFAVLVFEKYIAGRWLNAHPFFGHLYMLLLIPVSWTIFAIDDLSKMGIFFARLFPFFGVEQASGFYLDYVKYGKEYFAFFIAAVILATPFPYRIMQAVKKEKITKLAYGVVFAACVYFMYRGSNDPFLYFRF